MKQFRIRKDDKVMVIAGKDQGLSLIHISEPTRRS